VIAIAAGIATAKGVGESGRAALVTRGLAEMIRLGVAMGGAVETFSGLAGVGDLVLCCTSSTSRNMALGMQVVHQQGHWNKDTLTEGAYTAKAVLSLSNQLDVEMPICQAVERILSDPTTLDIEIDALLTRSLKSE
jgi:glycerol-3-phosphate dehydrogenase (NAD(P)+)